MVSTTDSTTTTGGAPATTETGPASHRAGGAGAPPKNLAAMSIDVEDWFQVENLKTAISRDSWDERELRVERNTDRMLEHMAGRDVRCTCFILGWIAEKAPALVRRIADAGHEIASHGFGHELIYEIGEDAFRADVDRSKKLLEDLAGRRVRGYRAPSFSITDWAIPILQELGFEYDSSAFPTVAHDRYGTLSGMEPGRDVVELRPGFWELCISCLSIGSRGVPWGGGGYFRLIPYSVFRRGVAKILASGRPYVFYIHPWEIDADQPRVSGLKRTHRFRHYVNIARADARFAALLKDFRWCTMGEVLERNRDG